MRTQNPSNDDTLLILAPRGRDVDTLHEVLAQFDLPATRCADRSVFLTGLAEGAAVGVLTLEALPPPALPELLEVLDGLPHWSAPPLVVLTDHHSLAALAPYPLQLLRQVPGVVFLERPLRPLLLVSTLEAALENRRRQYRMRDLVNDLEAAVAQRDRFLALLGHELRNPLAPLRHVLDALRLHPPSPDLMAESLELMDRQVHQLTHLVDDLLDVARIRQGRITLRPTRLSLQGVVEQAVTTVQPLFDQQGQHLALDLPSLPLWLEADETRLVQVLTNLLTNAARYTPTGGHIELVAARQGQEIILRVRDDGIGILPEDQAAIFDLLVQAGNGRHHSQQGLGLGLNLVQHLVRLHGGEVSVYSEGVDQGSTFTVRLPVLDNSAPSPAPETPPAAPGTAEPILVVDDNAEAADALALLLRTLGHPVQVAYGGAQALELTRQVCPPIVLLDLTMPEPDGYQVARQLRQRWGQQALRLIAVTGHGEAQRLQAAGFERHLLKPVGLEDLQRVLHRRD